MHFHDIWKAEEGCRLFSHHWERRLASTDKRGSSSWTPFTAWSPETGTEEAGTEEAGAAAAFSWPPACSYGGWSWNQKVRSCPLVSTPPSLPKFCKHLISSIKPISFCLKYLQWFSFSCAEPDTAPQACSQSHWLCFPHPHTWHNQRKNAFCVVLFCFYQESNTEWKIPKCEMILQETSGNGLTGDCFLDKMGLEPCLAIQIVIFNLSNHDACGQLRPIPHLFDLTSMEREGMKSHQAVRTLPSPLCWQDASLIKQICRSPWPLATGQVSAKVGGAKSTVNKRRALYGPQESLPQGTEKSSRLLEIKSHWLCSKQKQKGSFQT